MYTGYHTGSSGAEELTYAKRLLIADCTAPIGCVKPEIVNLNKTVCRPEFTIWFRTRTEESRLSESMNLLN